MSKKMGGIFHHTEMTFSHNSEHADSVWDAPLTPSKVKKVGCQNPHLGPKV